MPISLILTPFDHFHFRPTSGLLSSRDLTYCLTWKWKAGIKVKSEMCTIVPWLYFVRRFGQYDVWQLVVFHCWTWSHFELYRYLNDAGPPSPIPSSSTVGPRVGVRLRCHPQSCEWRWKPGGGRRVEGPQYHPGPWQPRLQGVLLQPIWWADVF